MANLTTSLGIGLSGLQAAQQSMSVIGHNIANINTPGYSQQSTVLTTNPSQEFGNLQFGTGVNVTSVQALRDQFLNLQLTQSICSQSGAETRSNALQAVSSVFTDNGTTGLNTQIQDFFASFQTLSANPTDASLQQNVVGKAQSLLTEFQSASSTITSEMDSINQQVGSTVPEINTLTSQIAVLNGQISQQINPSNANDAIDQRQQLTDQLAKLVGIQVSTDSHNNYQITLDSGAATLVGGQTSYQMTTAMDSTNNNYLKVSVQSGGTTTDVTDKIAGGTLGASMDLRDSVLPGYSTQLDRIAGSLANQVNLVNMGGIGTDANSTTGIPFFTGSGIDDVGTDKNFGQVNLPNNNLAASATNPPSYKGIINSLVVNPLIVSTPSKIATIYSSPSTGNSTGNNVNALKLADLQKGTATVDTDGDGTPDSGPFSTVVSGMINKVGTQAQQFNTTATNQENLTTALQTQKNSVSGVDMDSSAAQLLAFQQGYQAAAHFISTISQLTTQLMTSLTS
jgi:flagellar hook-associated protein 1 FlgK